MRSSSHLSTVGYSVSSVGREVNEEERQAAFERSAIPESGRLYGLALTIVGDRQEAEDVLQETMLAAWQRWATLRDASKRKAWLTRICVNQAIHRRRLLRRSRVSSESRLLTPSSGQPFDLEGRLLDVHRAFRRLSPSQRAVVTLHLEYGLTVRECAALLGCRPGTARSHLGRAVAKLREDLARE
jgi:RNA polymerase sigma-70 factor (ECF subfamily)